MQQLSETKEIIWILIFNLYSKNFRENKLARSLSRKK